MPSRINLTQLEYIRARIARRNTFALKQKYARQAYIEEYVRLLHDKDHRREVREIMHRAGWRYSSGVGAWVPDENRRK